MAKKPSKDTLQPPKGMRDILPEEQGYYEFIYAKAEEIAQYYGFGHIGTPHLEYIDLFTATVGESTDIVEKQMYSLKTRGKDRLVLRPEGTAPIMRAYISNGMHTRPQPVMTYYKGSFFRHEKPQKGRFREFRQFGLEVIGEEKAIAEATVIKLFVTILQELGLKNLTVRINSIGDKECRPAYRKELVAYYRKNINKLCKNCRQRIKTNPLRLLDCKDEKCQELKKDAPQILGFLCSPCRAHFKETLELLDAFDVSYVIDHTLVRGLDYYSRTVFEIFPENELESGEKPKGNNMKENNDPSRNSSLISDDSSSSSDRQSDAEEGKNPLALVAGGRYDSLSKILSKKEIPASGGAMGMERIIDLVKEHGKPLKKKRPKIFFIQIGQTARLKSIPLLERFRKAGIPVGQSFAKDGITSQLQVASRLKIPYAVILGQKEALDDSIIIRNMDSRSQETVSMDKAVEVIKNLK